MTLRNPTCARRASAGTIMVGFQIVSVDPQTRTALAQIESRPSGMGVNDIPDTMLSGTVIHVCDRGGCFFNGPPEGFLGRFGYAVYMQPVGDNVST